MEDKKTTNAERAVQRFTRADGELKEFLSDSTIRDIMAQFEHLVELRNQTLDEAVRSVKQELRNLDQERLVLEGIGAQKKYKRWYDAEFLARALPAAQSDLILTEKVVYELDQERLEQLARQGEIDNAVVRNAYREEEIAPASLPGTPKPYIIPSLPVIDD